MLCLPRQQLHSFTSSLFFAKSLLHTTGCLSDIPSSTVIQRQQLLTTQVIRIWQSGEDSPCPLELRSTSHLVCRYHTILQIIIEKTHLCQKAQNQSINRRLQRPLHSVFKMQHLFYPPPDTYQPQP